MASLSKNFHVRSNSLPSLSHPSTLRVDEELNKVRVLEASTASTSKSIYKGLSGLEDLYICVDEFLKLESTQHVISQYGHEECVEQLLDGSLRVLDVCEVTKDMLVIIKEQIKGLQSALRRKNGDLGIQTCISSFMSFRKKMKKDVKKLITTLKQVDTKSQALNLDSEALAVTEALREVSSTTVSILGSLLVYLSVSVKPRSSKWSLVSKLMHKEKVTCDDNLTCVNELEDVDVALLSLCKSEATNEKMQTTQEKLEDLDMSIEGFENVLEGVFRRLIRTRASILNIISL